MNNSKTFCLNDVKKLCIHTGRWYRKLDKQDYHCSFVWLESEGKDPIWGCTDIQSMEKGAEIDAVFTALFSPDKISLLQLSALLGDRLYFEQKDFKLKRDLENYLLKILDDYITKVKLIQ